MSGAAPATEAVAFPFGPAGVVSIDGGDIVEQIVLTEVARGPWDAGSAHGGAPAALLARAVERRAATEDQRISSLAYTFLGPVPLGPIEVRTRIRKPGKRLQIVHGEVVAGGRPVMEVRAVLLRRGRIALPAGVGEPWPTLGPPEAYAATAERFVPDDSPGFHPTAMEIRPFDGTVTSVVPARTAWTRLRMPIVGGETPSGAQRAAASSDFGNGLAHPVSFDDYLFVNCDLTVSLHRDPVGEWIAVAARTELDGAGTGLTTTTLHDGAGPFGTATQTLFVDVR